MKKISGLALLLMLLFACNNNNKKAEEKKEGKDKEASTTANSPLLGSYVGAFGNNKITLLITRCSADTVEGRSVVGGNDRPFIGKVSQQNGLYQLHAKEPGDDPYDGEFLIVYDDKKPDSIQGSWTPFHPSVTIYSKTFTLSRNVFKYLVDVGQYPQASKDLLKEEEVNNMMKEDLQTMRNEIFARHGYCFKRKELREQFEDKDWYIPNSVDIRKDLTEIEKKNLALIKKYEQYAETYGDDFGR